MKPLEIVQFVVNMYNSNSAYWQKKGAGESFMFHHAAGALEKEMSKLPEEQLLPNIDEMKEAIRRLDEVVTDIEASKAEAILVASVDNTSEVIHRLNNRILACEETLRALADVTLMVSSDSPDTYYHAGIPSFQNVARRVTQYFAEWSI